MIECFGMQKPEIKVFENSGPSLKSLEDEINRWLENNRGIGKNPQFQQTQNINQGWTFTILYERSG